MVHVPALTPHAEAAGSPKLPYKTFPDPDSNGGINFFTLVKSIVVLYAHHRHWVHQVSIASLN